MLTARMDPYSLRFRVQGLALRIKGFGFPEQGLVRLKSYMSRRTVVNATWSVGGFRR